MNSSSQSNYNNYTLEILNLKIETDSFILKASKSKELTLDHYSQIESNYENKLKKLQQLALNDLSLLDQSQIKLIIKRLEEINGRFDKFWKVYKKWFSQFEKQEFDIYDFKDKLNQYFTVQKSSLNIISKNTFFQLHDAVMFKQGSLLGLIEQVSQLVDLKKSSREGPTKQAIGLFCQLVNHSNLIKQGERTNAQYCIQVCQHFNLEYTDNVRQNYKLSEPELIKSSKSLLIVKETILPSIDRKYSERIYQYIDSKKK